MTPDAFRHRWSRLLAEFIAFARYCTEHPDDDTGAAENARDRALRAAWDFSELERNDAPSLGDYLGRMVALLPEDLLELRVAALDFAATPSDETQ